MYYEETTTTDRPSSLFPDPVTGPNNGVHFSALRRISLIYDATNDSIAAASGCGVLGDVMHPDSHATTSASTTRVNGYVRGRFAIAGTTIAAC
jgi:hypothetical protein